MAPKKPPIKAKSKAPAASKGTVQGHVAMVVRPTDSAPIGDQQVIKGSAKLSRPSPVIEDTHDVAQKLHHEEGQQGNPLPSSSAGTDDEANDASDKQETEDAEDRSLEVPPSSPTKKRRILDPSMAISILQHTRGAAHASPTRSAISSHQDSEKANASSGTIEDLSRRFRRSASISPPRERNVDASLEAVRDELAARIAYDESDWDSES
ncbi:hypothetical protein CVIRNUC_002710 [Coccomyxa viridis]|uniref:Uncharacterized protein n=1 Tax=Coccomyxa viridis TaxID=1274662 RepID=A0AAV1HWK8_9CHLO|nr:hypothetical protein CVIRNUC_002710 [Coccomyxa viridis]